MTDSSTIGAIGTWLAIILGPAVSALGTYVAVCKGWARKFGLGPIDGPPPSSPETTTKWNADDRNLVHGLNAAVERIDAKFDRLTNSVVEMNRLLRAQLDRGDVFVLTRMSSATLPTAVGTHSQG